MPLKNHMSGFGIIEMLVGIAISAVAISLAVKFMVGSQRASQHNEIRLDLRPVAKHIMNSVDCDSLPPTCSPARLISLIDRNNAILVNQNGTTVLAGWSMRAVCGPNGYRVQVAKRDRSGNFLNDPLTDARLDFDHPQSTLIREGTLCSARRNEEQSDLDIRLKLGTECRVTSSNALPCNPPLPPNCDEGYVSRGISLDTFGGDGDITITGAFGQQWVRYCYRIDPRR